MDDFHIIVFDVDGVIVDNKDKDGCYFWQKTLEADLGITADDLDRLFIGQWEDIVRGKIDLKDYLNQVFQDPFFKKRGLTSEKYITYWLSDLNINASMLELVDSLKIPACLGTNQETYRTAIIRERMGGHFLGCFSSCEIGALKPEEEFFSHIEVTLGIASPNNLLLIDDSPLNVQAAQKRGWSGYCYQGDFKELRSFLIGKNVMTSL